MTPTFFLSPAKAGRLIWGAGQCLFCPRPPAKSALGELRHDENSSRGHTEKNSYIRSTFGGIHDPLMTSGFGQYARMYSENGPSGAGSQFDSLSFLGDFAPA